MNDKGSKYKALQIIDSADIAARSKLFELKVEMWLLHTHTRHAQK